MHGICSCDNCKQRTGSAFGISAYFNTEQVVKKQGESQCYTLHNAEQNHDQERFFCVRCGTTLYWTVSTKPEWIGVAGGCFTENPLNEPKYSVNHRQKCAWFNVPESWQIIE